MGVLDRLGRAITISRPIFWLAPFAAYAAGLAAAGVARGYLETWELMLMTLPVSFYIYGINDLFDMEQDRENPRKGGMWGGRLRKEDAGWVRNACMVIAAVFLLTSLASLNPLHVFFTLAGLAVPYLYSAPPFRLKSVPLVDSITNAAYAFLPFAMAASLGGSLIYLDPRFIAAVLILSAVHAISTIVDYDNDRTAGQRTFAVALGPRAPALFAAAIFVINLAIVLPYSPLATFSMGVAAALSFLLFVFPTPRNAGLVFRALIFYALIIAYFFFFKYVVFPQYFADYSEPEIRTFMDACANSSSIPQIVCDRLGGLNRSGMIGAARASGPPA